jgi:anti-anti-sigma factor
MSILASTSGKQHTIKIQGRFDFTAQRDFRDAYEKAASNSQFILDFSSAEYMDSSALGMLLLLRDYAGAENADVSLNNCPSEIKSILEISNFQKLFKIS